MANVSTAASVITITDLGPQGPQGPAGATGAQGATGTISAVANITASGNISASGYLTAQHITSSGNISASGDITVQHVTASGNISSSFTSTGSFGRLEVETIKATTGEFAANTIKLGNETFNQANITKLKAGKSLRDTSTLQAKSYELADGRKISREFENRFNRWAPNLEFEEKEGADARLYNEVDQIPQTYIDFTDKEYRVNMFGGRSHQKQTLYNIELQSDYNKNLSSLDFKSPKAVFSSQYGDVAVLVSGSLTVSGSNTLKNYGNFTNYLKDRHRFKIEDTSFGNTPSSIFVVSDSGQAGVGTSIPKHTLHVSASSANFNALQVEGNTQFNGAVTAMGGVGNSSAITQNMVVPSGYNLILWTSVTNPSITVNSGVNYTISAGADVRIRNSA